MTMKEKLTLEQKELLNDSFWLAYVLRLIKKVDNIWIKSYISNFILFFASIYENEIIVANLGKMSPDITMTRSELNKMRNNNIKLLPMESTEIIKSKILDMGVNFNNYVFDMTVLCDNRLELFDTNFRMWEFQIKNEERFDNLNAIVNTPLTWTKRFLGDYYESISKIIDYSSNQYIKEIEKYDFKSYSYSSYKFFKNKITNDEKIYIIQRYGLVKSVIWFERIFKKKMKVVVGELNFDFEKFFMKIKAIVIEIIGNDRKNCDYEIINKLLSINNETIDNKFFKINRKVRDNIHYGKTNEITEEEIKIVNEYQDIYLKNVIDIFDNNINIKFNLGYKFALAIAKLEYWSRDGKNRNI